MKKMRYCEVLEISYLWCFLYLYTRQDETKYSIDWLFKIRKWENSCQSQVLFLKTHTDKRNPLKILPKCATRKRQDLLKTIVYVNKTARTQTQKTCKCHRF